MHGGIPGLYPLEAVSTPLPVVTTKMPPGTAPVENHWVKTTQQGPVLSEFFMKSVEGLECLARLMWG